MIIKTMLLGAMIAGAATISGGANASLVNAPVPSNAYIAFDGLDWAWASPVAADGSFGCCGVDLSYEGQFGWRLPTSTEMLNAPLATQFIFSGANVPLGGTDPISGAYFDYASSTLDGDAASAVPYFNDTVYQADWCNAPGSNCGFGEVPWWGQAGAPTYAESLVVRTAVSGVPESSTWAMMALGFAGLGFAGFRTSRKSVSIAA